jgi:hypothetical protein
MMRFRDPLKACRGWRLLVALLVADGRLLVAEVEEMVRSSLSWRRLQQARNKAASSSASSKSLPVQQAHQAKCNFLHKGILGLFSGRSRGICSILRGVLHFLVALVALVADGSSFADCQAPVHQIFSAVIGKEASGLFSPTQPFRPTGAEKTMNKRFRRISLQDGQNHAVQGAEGQDPHPNTPDSPAPSEGRKTACMWAVHVSLPEPAVVVLQGVVHRLAPGLWAAVLGGGQAGDTDGLEDLEQGSEVALLPAEDPAEANFVFGTLQSVTELPDGKVSLMLSERQEPQTSQPANPERQSPITVRSGFVVPCPEPPFRAAARRQPNPDPIQTQTQGVFMFFFSLPMLPSYKRDKAKRKREKELEKLKDEIKRDINRNRPRDVKDKSTDARDRGRRRR